MVALRAHLVDYHEAVPELIDRALRFGWTLMEFHSKWHWYIETGERWSRESEFNTPWEDNGVIPPDFEPVA